MKQSFSIRNDHNAPVTVYEMISFSWHILCSGLTFWSCHRRYQDISKPHRFFGWQGCDMDIGMAKRLAGGVLRRNSADTPATM